MSGNLWHETPANGNHEFYEERHGKASKSKGFFPPFRGVQKILEEDIRNLVLEPLQVLSIQSFKRGMPLVPSGEPIITIDAGERLGLKHWARFQPGRGM